MFLRFLLAAFTLALTTVYTVVAQTPPQDTTSIIHVTVIDVSTGHTLPDQTVVLQGDRILSLAAFESAIPLQGRVIDAHGGFLIPGLWDMHVHLRSDAAQPGTRLASENEAMLDLFLPNVVCIWNN